eukprot:TRINITY_DN2226_c0_g1_i2.p1 TRINITY_DN2226_c0_g1~~TRINITY_DN2226_c0_g1_i2.p1  ORF type:complete len:800 (-),score=133.37 TRINITY_DN2226_c0_g1_i2:1443-3842(-)
MRASKKLQVQRSSSITGPRPPSGSRSKSNSVLVSKQKSSKKLPQVVNDDFEPPSPSPTTPAPTPEHHKHLNDVRSSATAPLDGGGSPLDASSAVLPEMSPQKRRQPSREFGRIQLHLEQAANLIAADANGKSDPYCVVHIFGRSKPRALITTAVIPMTLNPVWDQCVSDTLDMRTDAYIQIMVHDKDALSKDDFLGMVIVPLVPLFLRGEDYLETDSERWRPLFNSPQDPTVEVKGSIKFEVRTGAGGMPEAQEVMALAEDIPAKLQYTTKRPDGRITEIPGKAEVTEFCIRGGIRIQDRSHPALLIVTSHRLIWKIETKIVAVTYGDVYDTIASKNDIVVKTRQFFEPRFTPFEAGATNIIDTLKTVIDFRAMNARCPYFYAFPLFAQLEFATMETLMIAEDVKQMSTCTEPFSLLQEFAVQQGLRHEENWHLSGLNQNYELCSTYPTVLYFPTKSLSATIEKSAAFRSRERLPVLTYWSTEFGTCITRSAQPKTGFSNSFSEFDERVVAEIHEATSGVAKADRGKPRIIVYDARSQMAAEGNKFQGKGVELKHRYKHAEILFMDIGNIHKMRDSVNEVHRLCATEDKEDDWLSSFTASKWPAHIMKILSAATRISKTISEDRIPVLVHCSDGWDRTSQLCALAQIILDPRFRTREGFYHLVEKEFCCFGHKFEERLGTVSKPNECSPVFFQFLECVYQLIRQYPTAFEFNGNYLSRIYQLLYSGWFGTFLCNSDKEREDLRLSCRTFQIWDVVNSNDHFLNPDYKTENHSNCLKPLPKTSTKQYVVWHDIFLQYDNI